VTAARYAVSREQLAGLISERHALVAEEMRAAARTLGIRQVHRARVAARTLRSVLATLRPLLRPALFERGRRDLRNAALELGAIRESDVRRDWLVAFIAGTGTLPPGARQQLLVALEAGREEARGAFRNHVASLAYRERLERLDATLNDPRLVIASGELLPVVHERVVRRWKRLRKALRGHARDAQSLHEIRLAAKHARYASEVLLPLAGLDPRPHVKVLKRLQDCLGDHRDAEQALAWLEALGEPLGPVLLAHLESPICRLLAKRERQLDRLRDRFDMPADLRRWSSGARERISPARRRRAGQSSRS